MKKVLLTTSALSLLAGAAAADVSLSGYGRIGVVYTGLFGVTTTYSRYRLNLVGSTETDGGLSFGAWTRIQSTSFGTSGGTAPGAVTNHRVWVSNGTMTLTLGNAGGAVAAAAGIWGCGVGFTGSCVDMADPSFANHTSSSTGGAGPGVVRVDFALGGANVSVSGGNGNTTEVAANFALGGANVGIGYAATATSPTTWLNVSFDAGSANVGVRGASNAGGTGWVAHVTYGLGAGAIYAYGGTNLAGSSTYGAEYSVGLGGGVTASVALWSLGGSSFASAGAQFNF